MSFGASKQSTSVDKSNLDVENERERILLAVSVLEERLGNVDEEMKKTEESLKEKERLLPAIDECKALLKIVTEQIKAEEEIFDADQKMFEAILIEMQKQVLQAQEEVVAILKSKQEAKTEEEELVKIIKDLKEEQEQVVLSLEEKKEEEAEQDARLKKKKSDQEEAIALFENASQKLLVEIDQAHKDNGEANIVLSENKKYLAEMEDTIKAAEQKYASVIQMGEQKLKDLLKEIEMFSIKADAMQDALIKREGEVSIKESWLLEKETTLRNTKLELEKHFNRSIPNVII